MEQRLEETKMAMENRIPETERMLEAERLIVTKKITEAKRITVTKKMMVSRIMKPPKKDAMSKERLLRLDEEFVNIQHDILMPRQPPKKRTNHKPVTKMELDDSICLLENLFRNA